MGPARQLGDSDRTVMEKDPYHEQFVRTSQWEQGRDSARVALEAGALGEGELEGSEAASLLRSPNVCLSVSYPRRVIRETAPLFKHSSHFWGFEADFFCSLQTHYERHHHPFR